MYIYIYMILCMSCVCPSHAGIRPARKVCLRRSLALECRPPFAPFRAKT